MRFVPSTGFMGDPVPFYYAGEYHLFYLRRVTEDSNAEGTPWGHAVSRDLVHWEELPDAFSPGEGDAPDCGSCWTGCVVEREGVFHAFYTGHAPGHLARPQTVCRATSSDLIHWQKDAANPILLPDPRWYENTDWRDPFVLWNDDEGCYWMVITARVREPAEAPRRGCLALATSPDLETWEVHGPIWTPYSVHAPECPDLWPDRAGWQLLFSNGTTQARYAPSLRGPWLLPEGADADGRWFYAAKCFHEDKGRHFLVGWIASRKGNVDAGARQWGGTISLPREAVTDASGRVCWRPAEEIAAAYGPGQSPGSLTPLSGTWQHVGASDAEGVAPDGMALARFAPVPPGYRLRVEVAFDPSHERAIAGLVLRYGGEGEHGYVIALDRGRGEVSIRPWQRWGDAEPYAAQPVDLSSTATVDVYLDGTVLEVFVNNQVALSARCYNHAEGDLCLWVQHGGARFREITLHEPARSE